jgi:CubicO group peptidase (beta-lactamase class C family)
MSHSAGLPGFDPPLTPADLYEWDKVCANLAEQAPWWEPGTAVGYHAVTQGFLQGELVRRVDGRTIGTFFREEVAEPLGADFHIGLDAVHDERVAELVPPPGLLYDDLAGATSGSVQARMRDGGPVLDATDRVWQAEPGRAASATRDRAHQPARARWRGRRCPSPPQGNDRASSKRRSKPTTSS